MEKKQDVCVVKKVKRRQEIVVFPQSYDGDMENVDSELAQKGVGMHTRRSARLFLYRRQWSLF